MPDGGFRCHERTSATTSDTLNCGVLGVQSGQTQMLLAAEEHYYIIQNGWTSSFHSTAERSLQCRGCSWCQLVISCRCAVELWFWRRLRTAAHFAFEDRDFGLGHSHCDAMLLGRAGSSPLAGPLLLPLLNLQLLQLPPQRSILQSQLLDAGDSSLPLLLCLRVAHKVQHAGGFRVEFTSTQSLLHHTCCS